MTTVQREVSAENIPTQRRRYGLVDGTIDKLPLHLSMMEHSEESILGIN